MPLVGGQNTMGRGRYTMGRSVDIPWVGGQNIIGMVVDIPWVMGSKYHG